jgi:hypothetical protein
MTAKQALQHPWLNSAGVPNKELKVGSKMSTYIEGRRKENPTTKVTMTPLHCLFSHSFSLSLFFQDILGF